MTQQRKTRRLAVAVALLVAVALAPLTSAQDGEPDETIPLVPLLDESTPESLFVSETCDPLELVICVGPVSEDMPLYVTIASDGVNATVWLHQGESESVGPFQQNVTVPVTGTEVPVTLCPNECPVPVLPEAGVVGTLTVCVVVEGGQECVTLPADTGKDTDGDGLPDAADPNATNPYEPYFWRKPCMGDESWDFSICKMEDGRYRIRWLGATTETSKANPILDGL